MSLQVRRLAARPAGEHAFALGLFGLNRWGGLTLSRAPDRWEPTWENTVRAATLAEECDLDFLLPYMTWTSTSTDDRNGWALESLTWASALLAVTSRITVFATVHVPYVHPLWAGKQALTCDWVGGGRFGLNVVAGAMPAEFAMFGASMPDHADRYALATEWIEVVKRMWDENAPFDVSGHFFDLRGVERNHPVSSTGRPLIVGAGSSPAGSRFVADHADVLFQGVFALDGLAEQIATFRATTAGRPVPVFGSGHIVCRPTAKETEEYYHYRVHEHGDWDAADYQLEAVTGSRGSLTYGRDQYLSLRERSVSGSTTYCIKGTPDEVVASLQALHNAGLDGMAVGLFDYVEDLTLMRDELVPRLERAGLRIATTTAVRHEGIRVEGPDSTATGLSEHY